MSKTLVHKIVVILGLNAKAGAPVVASRATTIVQAMQASKLFPSPTPAYAQALADITALTDAEAAFKSRLGTKAVRDDKLAQVVADMNQYHAYVQQLANADPTQAQVLVNAATMSLRKAGSHPKSDLAVKQKVSGTIKLIAKSVKGARAHNWQYSTDGGKTWIEVPQTTKAVTTITGLTPGVSVTYRHRALATTTGLGDWSQPVTALVV